MWMRDLAKEFVVRPEGLVPKQLWIAQGHPIIGQIVTTSAFCWLLPTWIMMSRDQYCAQHEYREGDQGVAVLRKDQTMLRSTWKSLTTTASSSLGQHRGNRDGNEEAARGYGAFGSQVRGATTTTNITPGEFYSALKISSSRERYTCIGTIQ